MFVKFKTPMWYIDAMEKFPDKICNGSDEFSADLKRMYCLADEINYANHKMQQAEEHRNKIKRQYGERLDLFYNKRSCSSNFNLFEFCATTNEDFFAELFEAKKLMKELQEYILSSRQTIKRDLGGMHDIWKKWYRKAHFLEKKAAATNPKKTGICRLSLTRSESLAMIKALTDALKKEPDKDSFIMTFNTDIH